MSSPLTCQCFLKTALSSLIMLAAGSLMTSCLVLPIPYKGYTHKTIQGVVVDARTGKPLEQANVRFRYFTLYGKDGLTSSTTSHDGSFILQPEKRTGFPYVIFSLSELPISFGMVVEKNGYQTVGILWWCGEQRGWCWNYRLFKGKDDVGTIKMNKGPVDELVIYQYDQDAGPEKLILRNEKENSEWYKRNKDFFLKIARNK